MRFIIQNILGSVVTYFSFFESEFSISPFNTRHLVIEELALSLCCVRNTGNPVLSKSMTNLGSIWTSTKYHSDSKKYAKLFVKKSNQNGFTLILIRQNFTGFVPDFNVFFACLMITLQQTQWPNLQEPQTKKTTLYPHFETFTGRWMQIDRITDELRLSTSLPFGLKLITLNTN